MKDPRSNFRRGYDMAAQDLKNGHIHSVPEALASFKENQPDSEWQWGWYCFLHKLEVLDK